MKTVTRFPKVIWEQAQLPSLVADSIIAATHNSLTILVRWHQCVCLSNIQFDGFTEMQQYPFRTLILF